MNTFYIPYAIMMLVFGLQSLFNMFFWRSFDENNSRLSLEYAVNSASDISTEYLLDFSQETPYGNIYIDPNTVWYMYKYILLSSTNLYSKNNMVEVEYFFPSVQIAVNDGYFMRLLTQSEVDKYIGGYWDKDKNIWVPKTYAGKELEWVYKFTQKIPFARNPTKPTKTDGFIAELGIENPTIPASIDSNPVVISDTMSGKNIITYYPNSDKYIKYQVEGQQLESQIGTAHSIPEIGLELLTALDYSMDWNSSKNSLYKSGGVIQIPIEITESLTSDNVTLIGPQVLVICDQFNWIGNYAMSFYTISNTQVVENILYYCYTRNNNKYYSTLRPAPNIKIEQVYTRQSQCAIDGYSPDPDFFN